MITKIVVVLMDATKMDVVSFGPDGVCTYGDANCLSSYVDITSMTIAIQGAAGEATVQMVLGSNGSYCSGNPAKVAECLGAFPGNEITDLFANAALPGQ